MIVIVVGMHRSGTSALAGVLHHHGVLMGEEQHLRPRPSVENPKGFYENVRFRHVSDQILEESGYRVKSWDPAIPLIRAGLLNRFRAQRLVSRYQHRYPTWGWKDPRVCLTLDVWLKELRGLGEHDQVRLVYISREADSVARSLVARGNTSFEAALRLWTLYNRRALESIDKDSVPTVFITYEELCREPLRTTDRLLDFLGMTSDPQTIQAFVDKNLDRHWSGARESRLEGAVMDEVESVASELAHRRQA